MTPAPAALGFVANDLPRTLASIGARARHPAMPTSRPCRGGHRCGFKLMWDPSPPSRASTSGPLDRGSGHALAFDCGSPEATTRSRPWSPPGSTDTWSRGTRCGASATPAPRPRRQRRRPLRGAARLTLVELAVPGLRPRVQAVADEADGGEGEDHLAVGRLRQRLQRAVEPARLVGVVVDRRSDEQVARQREHHGAGDHADGAEHVHRGAGDRAHLRGVEALVELLRQAAVPDVDRTGDDRETDARDDPLPARELQRSAHQSLLLLVTLGALPRPPEDEPHRRDAERRVEDGASQPTQAAWRSASSRRPRPAGPRPLRSPATSRSPPGRPPGRRAARRRTDAPRSPAARPPCWRRHRAHRLGRRSAR